MKDKIRSNWTSLLGALFVVAAFITWFQYSIEKGWITDAMKIGFGLLCGIGLSFGGLRLATHVKRLFAGEVMLGIGACIMYATIAFAGIYYEIWTPIMLLLGMSAVTVGICAYAFRYNSRLLMIVAMAGGLLAPMLMRPESDQVFALFLYLLVLNIAFLYLSIVKNWLELRIVGMTGTWMMYIVYFIHFSPPVEGIWSMPIRYALAAYFFYTVGLIAAGLRSKLAFGGLDLYLNAANGIMFGFWALVILKDDLPYGYVIAFMGLVYVIAGLVIYRLGSQLSVSSASFGLGGLLLLLMSITTFGEGILYNVLVWTGIAALLALVGQGKKWILSSVIGIVIWFYVGCNWYVVTWSTPRGEWFGVYVPFLNWGAMAWIALAALGFYFSRSFRIPGAEAGGNRILSHSFALLSHLIVGGLLTRQIENIFTEYFDNISSDYMQMALTVTWGCYALLLILWGAYYKERLFRWFGSAVLVAASIKAIFMDLHGQDALYKIGVLLALGGVSFAITWINGKWGAEKPENPEKLTETGKNEASEMSEL